ncbi:hypothetical protein GCM10011316_03270 [Roseibium aquae]|uniref:MobA/VirD2-like nuclease domain-containing protein n=1 Tax=Roseibium aquae TaxID=1323746 RepID=A0A916T8C0_9HYPH|nr:hypothetical protein [Roseibium aquae]GGB34550.1 hypothetical protein GCM10011316_03270 [Roseibium aquae]
MIAGVSRHARTQRESRALISHLLKPENNPRTMILGGTLATELSGAVADMQRLRDSTSADAAALHIYLSPSHAMTDDELVRAAEIVREHLGAADHAAALVVHDKERRSGEGHSHAHLVLGRVSPSGAVLESGFEKIKLETASRLIEFELGEEPVLARHHASAVRWLRQHGRADVADWLTAAHGPDPDKPQSAASPAHRQALSREGIGLSAVRATIRSAWASGGAEAVRNAGYEIAPGRKSGVFVVARNGAEIGSLDRLTGEKRAAIRNAMEAAPDQISRNESKTENTQRSRKPAESNSQPAVSDPTSEKSEKIRPERSGLGTARAPLRGKKKSGAEQVSEAAADQARRLAEAFDGRLDAALAAAVRRRSSTAESAEEPLNSRQTGNSENTLPPSTPIQRDTGAAVGDLSSEKRRPPRSPEEAAAGRYLDRVEAQLRKKITHLSGPDRLPESSEMTDTRQRLAAAAQERAAWDARHGSRITELRLKTGAARPAGIFAWATGATGRYDAAARELSKLAEERESLSRPLAQARRAVRILKSAHEARQAAYDDARSEERERLSKNLSLVPEARAALAEDPTIAAGGRKALATAARKRQAARMAEERRAELDLAPAGHTQGGLNGGR